MTEEAPHGALDDAIRHYVKRQGDGGDVVTGWVLTAAVQHPRVPYGDGYLTEHSGGLPYHAQLGLLYAAADEKKSALFANILREDNGDGY